MIIGYLKQKLSGGWHFMRILRLVFGVVFAVQAVMMKDYLVGMTSAFFLYQGVTNTGCCGESCAPTYDRNAAAKGKTEDIQFEEVK